MSDWATKLAANAPRFATAGIKLSRRQLQPIDLSRKIASRPVSRVLYGRRPCGDNVAAILLGRRLPAASRNQPGWQAETALKVALRAIPIRFCSRWGLPCRPCCQARGGLLPHPFTLTPPANRPASIRGRFAGGAVCFLWHFPWGRPRRTLSGTVFHGARTFLTRGLSALARAAARPTDSAYKGVCGSICKQKGRRDRRPSNS